MCIWSSDGKEVVRGKFEPTPAEGEKEVQASAVKEGQEILRNWRRER